MTNKNIVLIMATLLSASSAFANYTAQYSLKDARIIIFDNAMSGFGWIIGLCGVLVLLFIVFLMFNNWVDKKIKGK